MTELQDSIAAAREKRQGEQQQRLEKVGDPSVSLSQRIQQQRELRKQGVQTTPIPETDAIRRSEALGAQVGQQSLGEPGFEDLGARADIGLSQKFEEKRAKFMDRFPDGDFVEASDPKGGSTVLFRKSQEEAFSEFDAQALEKFEFIGDLADVSSEVPSALVELAVTRGGGLARQAISVFLGNVAGEAAKETVEELRGFQKETFGEVAERSLIQAAFASGAVVPSVVVSGPINAFRGAPLVRVAPGAKVAQRSAEALGLPRLLPSQIAQSPLVRRLGGQSGAIVTTIGEYIRKQNEAAVGVVMRLREDGLLKLLKGELRELHNDASDQILAAAKIPNTSLTDGGTALQEGVAEYDNIARAMTDRAYQDARAITEPDFDPTVLQDIATEVKARASRMGPEGASVASLADQILNLKPGIPVDVIQKPSGEVLEISATDQLRFLRSQAFDLKRPPPGDLFRLQHREASKLFAGVNKTLNEVPGSEDFVKAWQKANGLAADRFKTMEKLAVVQASKTETPAMMADRLAKPLQVDNIKTLKDTVPAEKFGIFQNAVKTDLVSSRNIDNLTTRLSSFDKPTRDLLLTTAEQRTLAVTAQNWERLKSLDIPGLLERQKTQSGFIDELTQTGQTRRIAALVQASEARPGLRRSIRAGMMEDIFNKTTKNIENELAVDPKKLRTELQRLRESGAIKLLEGSDIETLQRLSEVAEFIPPPADSGTSLQSASAVAGLREFSIEAVKTIIENIGVGRLLTSNIFGRVLTGAGKEALPFNSLRVFAATVADITVSMENEQNSQNAR